MSESIRIVTMPRPYRKKLGETKSPISKSSSRQPSRHQQQQRSSCRCSLWNCMLCFFSLVSVFAFSLAFLLGQRVQEKMERETSGGAAAVNTQPSPLQVTQQKQQTNLRASSTAAALIDPPPVALPPPSNNQKFHFVFTTDCKDPTQDWQAYTLFHSFLKSNQTGDITRIVTGCEKPDSVRRTSLEDSHRREIVPMGRDRPNDFGIYFAPAHPQQEEVGGLRKHMKYFNRPYGIHFWMEHVLGYSVTGTTGNEHDDTIVVTLDTDMLLLRPFEMDFAQQRELWQTTATGQNPNRNNLRVKQGQPMAQHASFPSEWWAEADASVFQQQQQPSASTAAVAQGMATLRSMTRFEIEGRYAAAPPFLVAAKDYYPLVTKWQEFTYPMYQALDEKILREPHGVYTMAAAVLQQPHQLSKTFSVQNMRDLGLDIFHETRQTTDKASCRNFPANLKPHVLQYSKRYALGDFTIGKHYVPHDFVGKLPDSCSKPLFVDPPDNIAQVTNSFYDAELKQTVEIQTPKYVDNAAFLLCEIIQAFNEASMYFKRNMCTAPAVVNMEKTVSYKS